jgi:hypothetical protein
MFVEAAVEITLLSEEKQGTQVTSTSTEHENAIGNFTSKGLFVGRWFPMVSRWLICIRHQIIPSFQL